MTHNFMIRLSTVLSFLTPVSLQFFVYVYYFIKLFINTMQTMIKAVVYFSKNIKTKVPDQ